MAGERQKMGFATWNEAVATASDRTVWRRRVNGPTLPEESQYFDDDDANGSVQKMDPSPSLSGPYRISLGSRNVEGPHFEPILLIRYIKKKANK